MGKTHVAQLLDIAQGTDAEAASDAAPGRLELPVRNSLFADTGVANKRQLVTDDTRLLDGILLTRVHRGSPDQLQSVSGADG